MILLDLMLNDASMPHICLSRILSHRSSMYSQSAPRQWSARTDIIHTPVSGYLTAKIIESNFFSAPQKRKPPASQEHWYHQPVHPFLPPTMPRWLAAMQAINTNRVQHAPQIPSHYWFPDP